MSPTRAPGGTDDTGVSHIAWGAGEVVGVPSLSRTATLTWVTGPLTLVGRGSIQRPARLSLYRDCSHLANSGPSSARFSVAIMLSVWNFGGSPSS